MKKSFHIKNWIVAGILLLLIQTGSAQNTTPPAEKPKPKVMGFTEPSPMDFNDLEGYISLFDGKSLKDWDGNPKFWRVEDGAIVSESSPSNQAEIAASLTGEWKQKILR